MVHMRSSRSLVLVARALATLSLVAVCAQPAAGEPVEAVPFSGYDQLQRMAQSLAGEPFRPLPDAITPDLAQLDYDQHRRINYWREKAVWRQLDLPFQLQFHHPGSIFRKRVNIHLLQNGQSQPFVFNSHLFDYGGDAEREKWRGATGFAGMRVLQQLNNPGKFDEVVSFLGGCYFRALGTGNAYGLSLRGVAVDAVVDGVDEQFPAFRTFWIQQPDRDARSVTIFALLDGPSLTGAYQFEIWPGSPTTIDVKCSLFFRTHISKLGLAPMTSMFLHGERSLGRGGDFRPEVHDSDGVLIEAADGEQTWRPLENAGPLVRERLSMEKTPRGFGLLQRDRTFTHYQDLEAQYHLRPSVWLIPAKGWPAGDLELSVLPSTNEGLDNVNVQWIPKSAPEPGERMDLAYRLRVGLRPGPVSQLARVTSSWVQRRQDGQGSRLIVDFAGSAEPKEGDKPAPAGSQAEAAQRQPKIEVKPLQGQVGQAWVERNPFINGWRLWIDVPGNQPEPVVLKARLSGAMDSEWWRYEIRP